MTKISAPRGMKDFLGSRAQSLSFIIDKLRSTVESYSFSPVKKIQKPKKFDRITFYLY